MANTGLVTTAERYAGLPLDVLGVEGAAGRFVAFVDRVLRTVWPTMFAYQFVVRLETAPSLLEPSAVVTRVTDP